MNVFKDRLEANEDTSMTPSRMLYYGGCAVSLISDICRSHICLLEYHTRKKENAVDQNQY